MQRGWGPWTRESKSQTPKDDRMWLYVVQGWEGGLLRALLKVIVLDLRRENSQDSVTGSDVTL